MPIRKSQTDEERKKALITKIKGPKDILDAIAQLPKQDVINQLEIMARGEGGTDDTIYKTILLHPEIDITDIENYAEKINLNRLITNAIYLIKNDGMPLNAIKLISFIINNYRNNIFDLYVKQYRNEMDNKL